MQRAMWKALDILQVWHLLVKKVPFPVYIKLSL